MVEQPLANIFKTAYSVLKRFMATVVTKKLALYHSGKNTTQIDIIIVLEYVMDNVSLLLCHHRIQTIVEISSIRIITIFGIDSMISCFTKSGSEISHSESFGILILCVLKISIIQEIILKSSLIH